MSNFSHRFDGAGVDYAQNLGLASTFDLMDLSNLTAQTNDIKSCRSEAPLNEVSHLLINHQAWRPIDAVKHVRLLKRTVRVPVLLPGDNLEFFSEWHP